MSASNMPDRQGCADPGVCHIDEIPRYVTYTSPVSIAPISRTAQPASLPLNLVALIVSFLDDVADIARVTRTSKLLYYMALPQLYRRVELHSYPEIRYFDGRPEGFGGGSPFIMALNGLVTKSHASGVQEFRVWGQWSEAGAGDFAKGRVPDKSMMLSVLLRAATDKMIRLQKFAWELDCKPLKTLYQGLAAHQTLTTLVIKFPSSREPRPRVMVPPIPNLRVFKATDIDPLCYPDDISMLMLSSAKLEDLRLHFSPRMRREAEPSVTLETYFGPLHKAGKMLSVRHFAMQNFFGVRSLGLEQLLDTRFCESATYIDSFGSPSSDAKNVYIDETWNYISPHIVPNVRAARFNEFAPQHAKVLGIATGLERLYLVSARNSGTGCSPAGGAAGPITPVDSERSPPQSGLTQLAREFLFAITRRHGATLKHLLLPDTWALAPEDVSDVVKFCPHLEQLGLALNTSDHSLMRLLMPFLKRITVVRILRNSCLDENLRAISTEDRLLTLSRDTLKPGGEHLKWIGLGDTILKMGGRFEAVNGDGTTEMRRDIRLVGQDEVKEVELWKMDTLSIDVDPIAPFLP